jgi:predicted permease
MSRLADRWMVRLARLLLRAYPSEFRRRHGQAYIELGRHRVRREMVAGHGAVRAWATGLVVLVADAVRTVPTEWRRHVGDGVRGGNQEARSNHAFSWVSGAAGDTRLAVRALSRRPGFAVLVVVTLGLGIGASTSVFGALDRIVLRPLPYPDGDRLAYLALELPEQGWQVAPFGEVVDRWRRGARTVEGIATWRQLSGVLSHEGESRVTRVIGVSGGLTAMLGVRALMGRVPAADGATAGGEAVLVVSERYWRGEWGSDPGVLGRPVRMNDTLFTVAGVWPESARLDYRGSPDFFRVLPPDEESPRGEFTLVLALLRRGVSLDAVEAELASLIEGIDDAADMVPVVNPPSGFLGNDYLRGLWLVFWAGILLLVVAVLTATNLMLGRADARTGEIRMRLALGSTRYMLVRLFLAESGILCLAGVALALLVASAMSAAMQALEPGDLVPEGVTGLADAALLFAAALAVGSALLCAVVPLALVRQGAARPPGGLTGSRSTDGPSRFRSGVVAAQAALAVVLVTGASLMARSLLSLTRVDTGMDLDHLVVASVRLPSDRYASPAAQMAFYEQASDALGALPGVRGVTTSSAPPLSFSIRAGTPFLEGDPEPVPTSGAFVATSTAPPGYFGVLGIPILEGRPPNAAEGRSVVVNHAFARARPGSVVGRRLRFSGDTVAWTVVGIAGDIRSNGLTDVPDRTQLYFPGEPGGSYIRFVVRTAGDPGSVVPAVRTAIAGIDPAIPLREATTGPRIVRAQTARIRFVAALLGGFAALGLVFAVSAVYGTLSIEVGRRVREVGLRMALGASTAKVLRRVVITGMAPVTIGAAAGSLAVVWIAPVLDAVLFQVNARDPFSLLTGIAVLFTAATLGCAVPAIRASRIEPAAALRTD